MTKILFFIIFFNSFLFSISEINDLNFYKYLNTFIFWQITQKCCTASELKKIKINSRKNAKIIVRLEAMLNSDYKKIYLIDNFEDIYFALDLFSLPPTIHIGYIYEVEKLTEDYHDPKETSWNKNKLNSW